MLELLQTAASAAAEYGVTECGACPVQALPPLLPGRKQALVPPRGTVITLLLPYYTGDWLQRNVALYAVPDDYHAIAGGILEQVAVALRAAFPQGRFVSFVDNSPIPEVAAAVLCGLGWRGKNGQLLHPGLGSMAFIGEIVTDLELPCYTKPQPRGSCGDCYNCLKACPTGALAPTGLDSARCRSAISQRKGVLTPWEEQELYQGGLAWGCDLCTLACPYNSAPTTTTVTGLLHNLTPTVTVEGLDALLPVKSYGWRGKAVLQRNLTIVSR